MERMKKEMKEKKESSKRHQSNYPEFENAKRSLSNMMIARNPLIFSHRPSRWPSLSSGAPDGAQCQHIVDEYKSLLDS